MDTRRQQGLDNIIRNASLDALQHNIYALSNLPDDTFSETDLWISLAIINELEYRNS